MSDISKQELINTRVVLEKTKEYIDKEDERYLAKAQKYTDENSNCKISDIQLNGESANIVNKTVAFRFNQGTLPSYSMTQTDQGSLPSFSQGKDVFTDGDIKDDYDNAERILTISKNASTFVQGSDTFNYGRYPTYDMEMTEGSLPTLEFDEPTVRTTMMTAELDDNNTNTFTVTSGLSSENSNDSNVVYNNDGTFTAYSDSSHKESSFTASSDGTETVSSNNESTFVVSSDNSVKSSNTSLNDNSFLVSSNAFENSITVSNDNTFKIIS